MAAAAAAAVAGEAPMVEEAPPLGALYSFGRPWPELNEGLSYTDTFRCAGAGAATTLIEFYSVNYKSSAPVPGWIRRIRNGQIMVDGEVVTDPDMTPRDGSKLVYRRLPWQEPFAPYFLDVLYEDDDMVSLNKPSGLQVLPKGLFQQRTVLAQLQWKDWKMGSSCSSKRKEVQSHPVPVHRLGRGTSGILLCAKTKIAKVQLASYFAEGTINAGNKRNIRERNLMYFLSATTDDPLYCNGGQPKFDRPESTATDEVMKGLCNLFLEIVGITYMHIGWFFAIQEQTSLMYSTRPFNQQEELSVLVTQRRQFTIELTETGIKMVKITAPLPLILQTREERLATAKQTS
ncbi:hypothetical protein ACP4OV_004756 [Aristida adscensionis]